MYETNYGKPQKARESVIRPGCLKKWFVSFLFTVLCVFPSFTMAADEYPFSIVTTTNPGDFTFGVQVKATVYVDCGDDGIFYHGSDLNFNEGGSAQSGYFTSSNANNKHYVRCVYSSGGNKEIKLKSNITSASGNSTYFSAMAPTLFFTSSSPSFDSLKHIKELHGTLAGLFPGAVATVSPANAGGGVLPCFYTSFQGAENLDYISDSLLKGFPSTLRPHMFKYMFANCTGLYHLPDSLGFDQMVLKPMPNAFVGMFQGCTNLTGTVPIDLFKNVAWTDEGNFGALAMPDIFNGTNLATCCPNGTKNVISDDSAFTWAKYTDYWETGNGLAVACASENATGTEVCAVPTGPEYKFFIETTNEASGFNFSWDLAADGTFYVDCGDSTATLVYPDNSTSTGGGTITREHADYNERTPETYTCRYQTGGAKTISFGGAATGYIGVDMSNNLITSGNIKTISFTPAADYLKEVSGSLGEIFNVSGTTFTRAFYNCNKLTTIPNNLFSGLGSSSRNMFKATFANCTSLTSIPIGLFSGVSGFATSMFQSTFYGCTGLTGPIPGTLFSGVSGFANSMFHSTFYGCTGLTGPIPGTLFSGVSGFANGMFQTTFFGCINLGKDTIGGTSTYYIPTNLFSEVSGTPINMFTNMFANTGFLECCPEEMRRITSADSEYNIARYVNYFSNKVSCINGTPAANEASWITLPGQSTPSCLVLDCGKELHVRNSDTLEQYDYPLFKVARTEKSLAVKINQNETCYAPLTEATTAAYGLHIKKDGALYRAMTREDLQN